MYHTVSRRGVQSRLGSCKERHIPNYGLACQSVLYQMLPCQQTGAEKANTLLFSKMECKVHPLG